MISYRITESGVLIVQPSGRLSADDFNSLQKEVDPWLEAGGKLRGLLIDAPEFPGWTDFAGLRSHLHFVRDHHKQVPRIAVASDSRFLSALPNLARHFVNAEFKKFDAGETAAALAWLESPVDPRKTAIRHAWFPAEQLIWVTVDGKITTQDYRSFLSDIEPHLQGDAKVSFLINLEDVEGVELGAMIADAKFGLTHVKNIKRMALVGDQKWTKRLASLPNPFALEIKAFDEDEEHDAWTWLIS